MGGLLRNASSFFMLLSGVAALLIGASAAAQTPEPDQSGPAKGGFDWKTFEGKYDFGKCQSSPSAIWEHRTPGTFVQIDYNAGYARNPAQPGLELIRANDRSTLALGWSIERVGEGRQTETNVDTGKVSKVMESYATADGVYGMIAWNRPFNVGWSTLQIRQGLDNVSYTMRQRTESDHSTREETCTLEKYVPKIPA